MAFAPPPPPPPPPPPRPPGVSIASGVLVPPPPPPPPLSRPAATIPPAPGTNISPVPQPPLPSQAPSPASDTNITTTTPPSESGSYDDDIDDGYDTESATSHDGSSNSVSESPEEEEEGHIVRQESSFANLSADSWVTVVSEYEKDGPNENLLFNVVEEEHRKDSDEEAAASEMHAVSALDDRSVLDCVVELLRGSRAQKRKVLRRYGERWIWLGDDLLTLNWKSKRRGVDSGMLNLTKVRRLRANDKELAVETFDGQKICLLLGNDQETSAWLTGLSCLVPKKARVQEGSKILKDRVHYDPLRDSWRGKAVATRRRINEYIMLGGIGKGASGQVNLALSTNDKRFYAVKVIPNKKKGARAGPLANAEEQAILRKLDHPNVVKHRDILEDKESGAAIVVVEFMARGVIMDSSKLTGAKHLKEEGVREIMRHVVAGLEYLHFQHIVHHDIKPDNLLRAGDGTVKISDFGEARMYDVKHMDGRKTSAPGTPAFIAPELCMSDKSPKPPEESYAADVWSLGASLFYMIYGRVPFLATGVFEIFDVICTEELKIPDTPKTSRKVKHLITRMLTKNPAKRATLAEVAKHPWFGGDVTQSVELKQIRITPADIDNAVGTAKWTSANKSKSDNSKGKGNNNNNKSENNSNNSNNINGNGNNKSNKKEGVLENNKSGNGRSAKRKGCKGPWKKEQEKEENNNNNISPTEVL